MTSNTLVYVSDSDSNKADAEPKDPWHDTLEMLWKSQSRWSRHADALKRSHHSWMGPLVVVTFVGIVLAILTPQVASWVEAMGWPAYVPRVVGTLASLLTAGSAYLSHQLLSPREVQAWVAARSKAEVLKSEGYIYAVSAPPYEDRSAAPEKLSEWLDTNLRTNKTSDPITKQEVSRHPHQPLTLEEYIKRRVQAQIAYHSDHAIRYQHRLTFWRRLGIALGLLSVLLGVVGTNLGEEAFTAWVAVVTTAIATITTYVYSSRVETLASSYSITARRLEGKLTRFRSRVKTTVGDGYRLVSDCEGILTEQNQGWAGELLVQKDDLFPQRNGTSPSIPRVDGP